MLHEMGFETGIDLERLVEAARAAQEVLGRPLGSHVLTAGPGGLAPRLALSVAAGAASVFPSFLVGALALQIRERPRRGRGGGRRRRDRLLRWPARSAAGLGRAARRPHRRAAGDPRLRARHRRRAALAARARAVAGGPVPRCSRSPASRTRSRSRRSTCSWPSRSRLDRQGLGFGIKQSAIPAAILMSGLALPVLALPLGWRVDVRDLRAAPRWPSGLAVPRGAGSCTCRARPALAAAVARAASSPRSARRSARPGRARSAPTWSRPPWTWGSARAPPACSRRSAARSSLATRVTARRAGRPPARLRARGRRGAAGGRRGRVRADGRAARSPCSCSARSWRSRSGGAGPASSTSPS